MDHRHSPEFEQFLRSLARHRVRHDSCAHLVLSKRSGSLSCQCGATEEITARTRSFALIDGRLGLTCRGCYQAITCDCPLVPVNEAALLAKMLTNVFSTVADADTLVPGMNDEEAARYGELREEFLKHEQVRYRTVERVRKAAADERTSRGGEVVYFVGSEDGKVKIGTSAHMEKRLEALRTSSSTKLTLLLTIPGGVDLETELHRRFALYRETGEWFAFADEIRQFVEGAAFYKSRVGS